MERQRHLKDSLIISVDSHVVYVTPVFRAHGVELPDVRRYPRLGRRQEGLDQSHEAGGKHLIILDLINLKVWTNCVQGGGRETTLRKALVLCGSGPWPAAL